MAVFFEGKIFANETILIIFWYNHFPIHCLYFIFEDMRVLLTGPKGSYIFYQRNTKRTKNLLMFPVKDKDIDQSIKTIFLMLALLRRASFFEHYLCSIFQSSLHTLQINNEAHNIKKN